MDNLLVIAPLFVAFLAFLVVGIPLYVTIKMVSFIGVTTKTSIRKLRS